jgi:hypothetical protein
MDTDVRAAVARFRAEGLEPGLNLGGGFNRKITERCEALRRELDWPAHKVRYLYGQYLVQPHVPLPTRGDVGAVIKLSRTGDRDTMKFSDTPAKSSKPGRPVLWLRDPGGPNFSYIVGQADETPPADVQVVSGAAEAPDYGHDLQAIAHTLRERRISDSPVTARLVATLTAEREAASRAPSTKE